MIAHHCSRCRPPATCSRVKSLDGLRILGSIAPQAMRAGQYWARKVANGVHACYLSATRHLLGAAPCTNRTCRAAALPNRTRLVALPPCPSADAKVVAFYRKLRERQLVALGLDPAQFKTIY